MFTNRKKFKIQGYTGAHRKALIKSQIIELVRNGRIKTTPSKARALKSSFDRIVTHAKKKTDASRRHVAGLLGNNDRAVDRLFQVIEQNLQDRNSGYTRLIKTLPRKGDNAEQVYVMLVNTEVRERKSKVQAALSKQSKKPAKAETAGKKTTVKGDDIAPTKKAEKQIQAKTRRNSM